MKRWTHREGRAGVTVSPDSVNVELRSQQSSITTLDRTQLPAELVDEDNLTAGAIMRCYSLKAAGTAGEQKADRDTGTVSNGWQCVTYQSGVCGWTDAADPITLADFKGGSLYGEWSGNALINPAFCSTSGNIFPGSPKYLRLRILVNGTVFAVRRGVAHHEHFRIFGVQRFPQGTLTVQLQFNLPEADPNDLLRASGIGNQNIPQAHIYGMRFFFQGRFR